MDSLLVDLSNNKLFAGCIMLITNIGSKYLVLDMPQTIEKLFSSYVILRFLVIFSIFFMATRDIKISVLLTLLFFIIVKYFINDKSTFCIIQNIDTNNVSNEDYLKAHEIIKKYELNKNKKEN
jgi:hypothetical protein